MLVTQIQGLQVLYLLGRDAVGCLQRPGYVSQPAAQASCPPQLERGPLASHPTWKQQAYHTTTPPHLHHRATLTCTLGLSPISQVLHLLPLPPTVSLPLTLCQTPPPVTTAPHHKSYDGPPRRIPLGRRARPTTTTFNLRVDCRRRRRRSQQVLRPHLLRNAWHQHQLRSSTLAPHAPPPRCPTDQAPSRRR